MSKFFIALVFIPFFIFSAPAGNPSFPSVIEEGFIIPDTKWVNFRLGYQTFNSENLLMDFIDSLKEQDFQIRKVKAYSNTAIFTLNIKERLDVYAEIGSYRLEPEFINLSNLFVAKSGYDILYRAGAKLILFEILDFTLAGDGKYSYFSASSEYLTQNDRPINDNMKFDLKEWQLCVGVSQKISILRPYIGVAYRDTKITMKDTPFYQNLDLTFQKKIGLFLGSSASLGSYVLLNCEIRLINERASIISGELRF